MEIKNNGAMPVRCLRIAQAALALAFTLLLASCGGGGVVPSTSVAATDATSNKSRTMTPEWAEYTSRKAVNYSPFRSANRDTELVTPEMIKQDLDLLLMGNFRLIRLFDSSINASVKIVKSPTAEAWAGTSVVDAGPSGAKIPFTANAKIVTLRVWAAEQGIPVRLKVEDAADRTHSAETEAVTTVAKAWQTLSFDFSKPAAGTAPLNLAYTYNKGSVFFNFGKTGAQGGGGTFYVDDPILVADDGSQTLLVAFESEPVVTGFGGAEDSTIVSTGVAGTVLQVIRDNKLDMKVHLGAYVQSDKYASAADKASVEAYNQSELAQVVALANEFSSIVLAVSIGNETMVSWSFNPMTPAVMAGYLAEVRAQIKQPITTDDNWAFYAGAPKIVIDTIDFAAVHTYAELDTVFNPDTWDWKQAAVPAESRANAMMEAAMASTKREYNAVRSNLDLKGQAVMPIIIGETGWNAVNVGALGYRAHPVNQKMYFLALEAWAREGKTGAGPAQVFYFEAFDEPWKGGDDKWGLFNVNRQARYVVQGLYPETLWEPGTYKMADALHWVPMTSHKVSAPQYTLYAESFTLNEDRPTLPTLWNAWENGTTATATDVTNASPPEGSKSLEITPSPAKWGWGLALNLKESNQKTDTSAELSDFASGYLNFSIKTTYPGMLEVGFYTGTGVDGTGYDVYVQLPSGSYGYVNDGNWHQVSIPVSALVATGLKADLSKVTSPFVIADRYAKTGKAENSRITSKIHVDSIFWSR